MKNTIGLLFLGLIICNGLADVSHLAKPGHNHYLPPPIQDLPVDQDYNGIDSQPQNGVSHSPQNNANRGYLPPYQSGHGHGHYDDDYDHNIEISYHNDFAVQPQSQIPDQADGGHEDDNNEDHVDIDHQQLEPIFPSNFPIQGYLTPSSESQVKALNGHRQGKPDRGEDHSISLVHYHHNRPILSSPAPFTLAQTSPSPSHGGYDYPKPTQSADFLYSNQKSGVTSDLSEPEDEHEAAQRGYLPPPPSRFQVNTHPEHSQRQGSQQGYLPPVQSSHGAHHQPAGHSHQEHQQGYLPPVQSSLLTSQQSAGHSHHEQQQGYLPPVQSSHGALQQPAGHSHHEQQQGYLPPVQSSHGAHHQSAGHDHQEPHQDYLPPGQSHQHDHPNSGGYLPPKQESHSGPGSRSHSHHHHNPQVNLNKNSVNSLEQDYLPPVQSNHVDHDVHPTQSSSLHHHHEHRQNFLQPTISPGALELVPPPQLDIQAEHPASSAEVTGHINVPLPIPQVGYFFIPGVVSRIPSLNEAKTNSFRPALNIPGVIAPEQPKLRLTQRLTSPEYTRAFLLQKHKQKRPTEVTTSNIVITPSVQTLKQKYESQNQHHHHRLQHESPETLENLLDDLDYASKKQNLQTLVTYPQNSQQSHDNRQYLPPHDQPQDYQSHEHQQQSPNRGLHGHTNQQRNNYQGRGYLPPLNNVEDHHHQHNEIQEDHQHHHHNNPSAVQQEEDHHHHHNNLSKSSLKQRHTYHQESIVRGYLPPSSQNQITSLQTYMKGVHPNDRYGSSHYQQPPQNEKGNPPPPVATSPPMYNSPSAVKAYAPGMAYRVSNNAPFSTFTPATYLPPVESSPPPEDNEENDIPIGFQLNEEAKRSLAKIMPKDNTLFPLDALLDSHDNDEEMVQLMDQLRGRVRTVQIIDNHANTVKTFKVLEAADHKGVKTIKILGHAGEDPMGDHQVIRIISQGPNAGGIHQTVKIFSDHKEVTLPTTNAYLPPPKAKETFIRVLRNSQADLRSH